MAQILDKQGLQHYANKMCNADNRKVGSKSLPTALNDIDIAIDGFKTLFETEYGTPVNMELENNENVFSIGTGTNIDKKNDVENSFTDVELSGNSLVNLVTTKGGNLFGISGNGVKFNRAYNTDLTRCIYTTQEETGSYITIRTGSKERIKSNTTYTLIFNIFKNNISELQKGISIRGSSDPYYTQTVSAPYFNIYTDSNFNITSGIKVISFTTGNNANEYTGFGFGFPSVKTNVTGQQFEIGDVILLEGDYTNKPIPQYFEGLKSVGEKEDGNHKISISSRGKNLFDKSNGIKIGQALGQHDGLYDDSTMFSSEAIKVKPNTTYRLTEVYWGWYCDGNKKKLSIFNVNHMGGTITTPLNCHYIRISGKINALDLVQIECNNQTTNYESFRVDKKEISLNEPLRGLPNGVKDTIEKVNGEWKIIRRCGEIIFDGITNKVTDYHPSWSSGDYHAGYSRILNNIRKKGDINGVADNIIVTTVDKVLAGTTMAQNKGLWLENYTYVVYFSIPKSETTGEEISGINNWLTNNNTKLIYELENYIIEDIDPITLQCWKNGTISLADEVIPAETTHTVALNKSAQIQKNIEELTVLRNRVKALEEQYDKTALNQAYEVELLRLDMQLDNII